MAKKLILLMVLVWPAAVCFGDAAALFEQAQQLHAQGRFVEPEAVYRQIIAAAGGLGRRLGGLRKADLDAPPRSAGQSPASLKGGECHDSVLG